jgi:hypothetical protein
MTIPVLPEKHVNMSESLLGLGALILSCLTGGPKELDDIWVALQKDDAVRHRIHGTVTLDSAVLAIDFLFAIGAVQMSREGVVSNAVG